MKREMEFCRQVVVTENLGNGKEGDNRERKMEDGGKTYCIVILYSGLAKIGDDNNADLLIRIADSLCVKCCEF